MPDPRSPDNPLASRVEALLRRRHELVGLPRGRPGEVGPAEGLTHSEYARISDALFRLQRGLTGNRSLIGARYMDDPDLLSAYLFFYWPVSYAQIAGVLAQSGLRPARILDMGSGPGPAAAALLDAGAESAVLVDSSSSALDLARRVLAQGRESPDRLRYLIADLEGSAPYEGAAEAGPYDCVVFGHSLNELWIGAQDRTERVLALASAASGCLSQEGFLLVVEPALLATSREALALRDGLAAAGWSAWAARPWPRGRPTPATTSCAGRPRRRSGSSRAAPGWTRTP